jgi:hypothetical protein
MMSFLLGAVVTLIWNANPASDAVTGYKIHVGNATGTYSENIDVGNVTTYRYTTKDDTQTTYFAATAYNAQGKESGYSKEAIDPKKPTAPTLTLTWE